MATIRPATPADAAALTTLAARTFRDAPAAENRPVDLERSLATVQGPAPQARELADPAITTLAAGQGGALVGFGQRRCGPAARAM